MNSSRPNLGLTFTSQQHQENFGEFTESRSPEEDKMNGVLLTGFMLAVTLHMIHSQPCTRWANNNGYNKFATRHILQEWFERDDKAHWEWYLRKMDLWCRVPVQTFVEAYGHVEEICSELGRRMTNPWSNLCVSATPMEIYDVSFDNNCGLRVRSEYTYVTVACDIVGNECLPVHFERYPREEPSNLPCEICDC